MFDFDTAPIHDTSDYRVLSAFPLSGGLTNRCWKIAIQCQQTQQHHWCVWRPISKTTQAFGISRADEHQILQVISEVSVLAPRPVALLSTGLLAEWIEGKSNPDLSCRSLMSLLVQVHHLPKPDLSFDFKQKANVYWQSLPEKEKTLELRQQHEKFQSCLPRSFFSDVCCHHDMGPHNIIDTEEDGYRIIDWEYAATGDPSFDLALAIMSNDLDISEAVLEYCDIKGVTNHIEWQRAVLAWLPWCEYLSTLWYNVSNACLNSD